MRRIKETYLLLLIVIGLFSLSVYSTYALFTEQYTVGMLNVNTNIYDFNLSGINNYKHIDTYAGETQKVTLNILNSTETNLYYGIYTDTTSTCINYNIDTNYSNVRDIIEKNVSKTVVLEIVNTCSNNKALKLYTITSNSPLDNTDIYPENKVIISKANEIIHEEEIDKEENTPEENEEIETNPNISLITHITSLYDQEDKTTITTPNKEELSLASTLNLEKDNYGNIRYYGKNPNNYINFNNELWRIIGIFDTEDKDGNIEKRIKIIRNESISNSPFDSKPNTYGTSTSDNGSNSWLDSRLMMILNPNYNTEQLDNNGNIIYKNYASLYWNKTTGICYTDINNITADCDFSTTGLTDNSKKLLDEVKYYLGSIDTIENLYPTNLYQKERENTIWTGYIGLMYPSDFAYAIDPSICTKTLNNYNDSNCSNWLSDSSNKIWTITPVTDTTDIVVSITENNILDITSTTNNTNNIKPVAYLKTNIIITEGDGTQDNPYKISIEE